MWEEKFREVVIAGHVGWKRRRRLEQGIDFYRGASSTLKTRMRKKLLDKVNWYKTSDKIEKEVQGGSTEIGKKRNAEEAGGQQHKKKKEGEAKAVMLHPYTVDGELAQTYKQRFCWIEV